ncbi:MFS transporter [Streptosporangium sp. NPDC049644]|uniref:MFS transporter n=1 Tax=Streptosporangium sp. NPDC049644 TaxID=3155507 RepID=UPI003428CB4C
MRQSDFPQISVRGHTDFRRLWTGLAISRLGSAVGIVALPVIAVTVVGASTFQVALLSALTAITTALLAFPLGGHVEFKRKRPIMITADVIRFACLASVPIAALLGLLTFAQLGVIAVVNAACQIAFTAAAQAHLKALVSAQQLIEANSRLKSTRWLGISAGPSLGGALIGFLTAVGSLVIDALSFLVSALAVRTLRTPEPAPPVRDERSSWRAELFAGWRFAWGHPILRPILISWVAFAGASSMAASVSAVFYLHDLDRHAHVALHRRGRDVHRRHTAASQVKSGKPSSAGARTARWVVRPRSEGLPHEASCLITSVIP